MPRLHTRALLAATILLSASSLTYASQHYVLRAGSSHTAPVSTFRQMPELSVSRDTPLRNAVPELIDNQYSIADPDFQAPDRADTSMADAKAVAIARKYRGTRYVWGGTTSRGFDCSGFVRYVYARLGRNLPRTAREQFHVGQPVTRRELKPGDVLFFHTSHRGVSHVGIYVGNNNFIHAANPHKGVTVSSLDGYYGSRLVGARRFAS